MRISSTVKSPLIQAPRLAHWINCCISFSQEPGSIATISPFHKWGLRDVAGRVQQRTDGTLQKGSDNIEGWCWPRKQPQRVSTATPRRRARARVQCSRTCWELQLPLGGCDLGQKHQLPPWLWSGRDRPESKDGGHVHASLLLLGPPSSNETLEVLLRWCSPQRQLPGPPSQVRNGSIKQIEKNRTRYLRVQGFGGFSPYSSPCIISHCFNLL